MELSRHELFEHLLDQLNMAKDDPAFKDGKIKQVIVHRKSKCWEFDIVLRKVMPYELFRQFVSALQISFRELAGVDAKVRIDTPTDELDAKAIGDYPKSVNPQWHARSAPRRFLKSMATECSCCWKTRPSKTFSSRTF